jgi:hypothetical protein
MLQEIDIIQLQKDILAFHGLGWLADRYRDRPLDVAADKEFIPFQWVCPGVYRIRVVSPESEWFGAEYIGQSMNVRHRLMGHLSGSGKIWSHGPGEIFKSHLEARVLSLFPNGISRRDLLDCEHHWVNLLKPQLNKAKTRFGPASIGTPRQGYLRSNKQLTGLGPEHCHVLHPR